MLSQLRIYTINPGMMDQWVELFKVKLIPIYQKLGFNVAATWRAEKIRRRPPNSTTWEEEEVTNFIWIITFQDQADLEAKEAAFYGSDEWKAIASEPRRYIQKAEVRAMSLLGAEGS